MTFDVVLSIGPIGEREVVRVTGVDTPEQARAKVEETLDPAVGSVVDVDYYRGSDFS